ncbi:UNVERIFIED_CONTAM: hypothetical protein PYX00_007081 [Menopon gallinae]|uniref:Uncharacterized protein n=1 Tax=Menopon gallinae TaxID=328185 RepID=A0AAW2HID2_9NEOP
MILRNFYNPKSIPECETRDQDPFSDCNPVDCYIKYSGLKNYYNERSKVCQKVPVCVGNPKKELADIVYVPYSNTCRDLEKFFTEEDIVDIVSGKVKTRSEFETGAVTIQCHHGVRDPKTGLCVCEYGWKSEAFNPDGENNVYHMCNVKCHRITKQVALMPFLIGVILSMWMILCVCFCEKYHFARQFMTRVVPSTEADCSCTHYVVDETAYHK